MKYRIICIAASLVLVQGCAHNPAVVNNTAAQIQALTKPGSVAAELRTRAHYAR